MDNNSNISLKFNIDNLKNMKKEMLELVGELGETCKKCYAKIDESKQVYNTPTGEYFRQRASDGVLKHQSYINDVVIPYINQLDIIINEYEQMLGDIKTTVEGKVK